MYEKFPISGIKQSYRSDRKTPTVVMPIIIGAIIAAMAVFFIRSKPDEVEIATSPDATESQSLASNEEPEKATVEEISTEAKAPAKETSNTPNLSSKTSPAEPTLAATHPSTANEADFTPWMSPSALDTHIRSKSDDPDRSFWEQGNWITAVEGRWVGNEHEFRITVGAIPDPERWQWQYRVNQSADDFEQAVRQFSTKGFKLAHMQTYEDGEGKTRIQAVWRKEVAAKALPQIGQLERPEPAVAETAPAATPEESTPKPAEVAANTPAPRIIHVTKPRPSSSSSSSSSSRYRSSPKPLDVNRFWIRSNRTGR